jgi:hypothetical protein
MADCSRTKLPLAIDSEGPAVLSNVACNYSQLGRIDESMGCLERALALGEWYINMGGT